jgi:hypothetical protein
VDGCFFNSCQLWTPALAINKFGLNKQIASFARQRGNSNKEVMEDFAELMQRLLEIQSGGRQTNPKLVEEDQRLADRVEKLTLAGKPPQMLKPSQS